LTLLKSIKRFYQPHPLNPPSFKGEGELYVSEAKPL